MPELTATQFRVQLQYLIQVMADQGFVVNNIDITWADNHGGQDIIDLRVDGKVVNAKG